MKTADIIQEIRPTLKHPCNLALLDYLNSFNARRKVTVEGQQFIAFGRSSDEDRMFLPLGKRGNPDSRLHCSDEMREFYSAFDGLRECMRPYAGNFVPCDQIQLLADMWDWKLEDFPGVQKHASCPIVFESLGGDMLIQTPDGKFAWYVLGEDKAKRLASSFACLLDSYVAYRRVGDGAPFDSYGR